MAKKSTNYFNTLIEIAENCKTNEGVMPPVKSDTKTVANHQLDMIFENPYTYTSDNVLFGVFTIRKEFTKGEMNEQRENSFPKGQPCLRASPLTKSYDWGIHSN
jgi:hypothetical protein